MVSLALVVVEGTVLAVTVVADLVCLALVSVTSVVLAVIVTGGGEGLAPSNIIKKIEKIG